MRHEWWQHHQLARTDLLVSQLIDLFEALTDWWAVRNNIALTPDLGRLRGYAETELSGILSRQTRRRERPQDA